MIQALLKKLNELGVILIVNEGKLRIEAPEGTITDYILKEIKENKNEIINFYSNYNREKVEIIPAIKSASTYLASSSQRRMWILNHFQNGKTTYNIHGVYNFKGNLNLECLIDSLELIVKRHESLRTIFVKLKNGEIHQEIKRAEDSKFKINVSNYLEKTEQELQNSIKTELNISFDLEQGPLFNINLYQIGENEHVLTFVLHHIISDGWSIGVLVRDVLAIYNAKVNKITVPLNPLTIQYKDYAAWQQKQLQEEEFENHKGFWLETLKGELPVLKLPTSYKRPSVKTYNGSLINNFIRQDLSSKLNLLCKENNGTLFMGLLSLLNILLSKYTATNDIVVGSPIAGRDHFDLENQIGFYANTIVLRSNVDENKSFIDLLLTVKETTLGAYDHQIYPFDELVNDLNLERDISRNPLFDIMIVLQNNSKLGDGGTLDDIKVTPYEMGDHVTSKFDMTYTFTETDNGLSYSIEYNTDIYNEKIVKQISNHFNRLLEQVVNNPKLSISKTDYLTDNEKEQLLHGFNNSIVGYSKKETIIQAFEDQVKKEGSNVAISFKGVELTYAELNKKANQLATFLKSNYKIEVGDLIGLKLERSEWIVISILAVLKTGAAYVPIDPQYPNERIKYIENDCDCKVIIDQLELEKFQNDINNYSSDSLNVSPTADSLIYIIYTSGTTGNPKGVMVENRNLLSLLFPDEKLFDFNKKDVWTLFHSYCFDFSVWEIFGSLLNGGKLIIVPQNITRDPLSFKELLIKEGVTILNQTPSSFYGLSNVFKESKQECNLRYVIFGGEALSPSKLSSWHTKFPKTKLINMYGITETTVHVTYKEIGEVEINSDESNIGKALTTLNSYILGQNLELLPQGLIGELYIGGHGVTRGYLNRPDLTEERFVPNPYVEGERLYQTGDLARMLPNGELIYSGRKDNQVKVRGHRIELGEIESILQRKAELRDAVVISKESKEGETFLVAYVCSNQEQTIDVLRNYLKGQLPIYMVPSYFVQLETLPLTSNGKVDKKALPDPEGLEISTGIEYLAPRNETEKKLVEIWESVLEKEKIGIKEDFFLVGGDSLVAINVISKINEFKGARVLRIADLYENSTIRLLGQLIDETNNNFEGKSLVRAKKVNEFELIKRKILNNETLYEKDSIIDIYPMSSCEIGMVFQNINSNHNYHDQFYYQIDGTSFNYECFKTAMDSLIKKHENLRSAFSLSRGSDPLKVVYDWKILPNKVSFYDFSAISHDEQKNQVEKILSNYLTEGFNIELPGLWSICLFKLGNEDLGMLLDFHHAILDGWSVASLTTELSQIYFSLLKGEEVPDLSLKSSYKDSVIDQFLAIEDPETIAFWKNEMEDYQKTPFPFNEKLKTQSNYSFMSKRIIIGQERSTKINNSTLFKHPKNLFLSALLKLLNFTTNEQKISVGLVSNFRSEVLDGDKVLGCFLNPIPFSIDFDKKEENRVEEVELRLNEFKKHENFPLIEISNLLGVSNQGEPLFDIMFNYVDFHINKQMDISVKTTGTEIIESFEKTEVPFDVSVSLIKDEFEVQFTYRQDLFSEDQIVKLESYFLNIIDSYLESKGASSDDILSKKEINQLRTFSGVDIVYKPNFTFIDSFNEVLLNCSNEIAVKKGDLSLTYQEVDEQSNQIAHYLISQRGIKNEDAVILQISKSITNLPLIIGIWKAGAYYVPISPSEIEDKVNFIIEDCHSKLLIDDQLVHEILDGSFATSLINKSKPTDLSYVIYTSGTTGNPKGVMIQHDDFISKMKSEAKIFKNLGGIISYQITNYCFDVSLIELFSPLLSGGTCVFPNTLELDSFEIIGKDLEQFNVNVLQGTPSFLHNLFSFLSNEVCNKLSLNFICVGGELLDKTNVVLFNKKLPSVIVYNHYGPTECTIDCLINKHVNESNTRVIGSPMENTFVLVLNKKEEQVPIGVVGEIFIGGHGIARGYLNNDSLTRKNFKSSKYSDSKIYKTGDIGRWLKDGTVEFLGRKDNQIKLNGIRIELEELESKFKSLSLVKEATLIYRNEGFNNTWLEAYVSTNEEFIESEIRTELSSKVQNNLIPRFIFNVENIPLTPNGKIDKQKLINSKRERTSTVVVKDFLENSASILLKDVWKGVLKIEDIGPDDNYYAIGGDSIKSIQIISRIREKGYTFSVKEMMTNPTIRELTKYVKPLGELIDKEEVSGAFGLTPIQRWFFESSIEKNQFFQFVVLKKDTFSIEKIQRTLNELIKIHSNLRTRFISGKNGEWTQEVTSLNNLQIEIESISENTSISTTIEKLENKYLKAFNIEKSELVKATLINGQKDYLFLGIHHLVVDGVSWRILLEDFQQIYAGSKIINSDSYGNWFKDLEEFSTSLNFGKEEQYWNNIINEEVKLIPKDFDEKFNVIKENSSLNISIDKQTLDYVLSQSNRSFRTEINDILISILGLSLKKVFGENKLLINVEGHGREDIGSHIDVSRTVGWFTSVFPVLVKVDDDLISNIIQTKESLHRIPNKGIGYGVFAYLRNNESKKEFEKLKSSVLFNYLGELEVHSDKEVKKKSLIDVESFGVGVDFEATNDELLSVTIIKNKEGYSLTISYSQNQFKKETIELLLSSFEGFVSDYKLAFENGVSIQKTPVDFTYSEVSLPNLKSITELNQVADIYELSPLQKGLYSYWLVNPNSETYFEQFSYKVNANLNLDLLEECYYETLDRHDILRTYFSHEKSSEPVQIVENKAKESFYRFFSTGNPDDFSKEIKNKDRVIGFDLQKYCPIRVSVISFSESKYEIIWSNHHILMDGWCTGLLIKEFTALYYSKLKNQHVSLPPVNSYKNYILWLRDIDTLESISYWGNYLQGYDEIKGLPQKGINNDKLHQEYHVEDKFDLGKELSKQFRDYAISQKTTENVLLQTLWGVLLSKYNNCTDVVFGTVVSGRPTEVEGIEEMIGLFINTVPVRIKYETTTKINHLLTEVQNVWLEGGSQHYTPISEISANNGLEGNLFDHVVIFENYPVQEMVESGVKSTGEKFSISSIETFEQTNFDFNVIVSIADTLNIKFLYNPGVYDEDFIKRIKSHFIKLICSCLSSTEELVINLDYIPENEKNQLLVEFNDTGVDYPKDETIVGLFENQVEKTPNNVAVVFENVELTYRELNEKANQLGHYLKSTYSIESDDLIGIKLDRSEQMIIAILGVLKSGAAYVPIDPEYPQERIKYIEKDSNCKVVIDEKELSLLSNVLPITKPDISTKSTDLAYIIYTSGSTGKPKGVAIENRNTTSFLNWSKEEFNVDAFKEVFGVTSICFDLSIYEIFFTLSTGKILRLLANGLSIPEALEKTKSKVLINTVPSVVKSLLEQSIDFSKVSVLNMAGEPIPQWFLKDLLLYDLEIRNLYGPSEDTTYSTVYRIKEDSELFIGSPISNTKSYILGDNNELLSVGSTGEICLSGSGLSRGYLNKEQLTQEKFITHPFIEGERLYKTGDLGRWLANGNIEFIGRKDDQVKIRGYRIELGEIERNLQSIKNINEAVVVVKLIEEDKQELVSYIKGDNLSISKLRNDLGEILPSYMIPNHFIELKEFPLTPNGKIDKKALPNPEGLGMKTELEYIAPRNEIEQDLVEIWSEVLRIPKMEIGINDNFFDLGGHSLKLIKMLYEIKKLKEFNGFLISQFKNFSISEIVKSINVEEKSFYLLGRQLPNKKKMVLLPPILGLGKVFNELADSLDKDYNVHTLNYYDLNLSSINSFENLAKFLVKEIISLDLNDEFILGGYSIGSRIALCISKELENQGVKHKLLIFEGAPSIKKINHDIDIDALFKHEVINETMEKLLTIDSNFEFKHKLKSDILFIFAEQGDLKDLTIHNLTYGELKSKILAGTHDSILQNKNITRIKQLILN